MRKEGDREEKRRGRMGEEGEGGRGWGGRVGGVEEGGDGRKRILIPNVVVV